MKRPGRTPGSVDRESGDSPHSPSPLGAIGPLRRRLLVATAAAAPLGAAGCATGLMFDRPAAVEQIPAATSPQVRVGDRWVYQTINRYNRSVIDEITVEAVAVAPEVRVRLSARDAAAVVEERYAGPWTVIAEATFDRPIVFETPMPLVPDPPATGSSFKRGRYRAQGFNGLLQWDQRVQADRWERLQVPAGSFDCLRIVRTIDFEHPDIFRHRSERSDVLWYAPQVNRWVQREWTGNFMPGAPTTRFGRAREDWVLWQLMSYRPA
jgi:hypothetical protein